MRECSRNVHRRARPVTSRDLQVIRSFPNAPCFGLIGDQTLPYPPPAEDMGAGMT